MGPALSSLVAPQVVITTSGAARGGRVGFVAALDCSMFNVYSALTIRLSLLAPIFHPKLSKMLHSSPVRARYGGVFCELRILMIVKPEFWLLLPVLCSMSCYTGRDISKASRNYISETNVSHISYIMLTCIISLP